MARIRTVKPEFFRHHALYAAEKETGLPLRIAFAGLWTAADREGRFKWRPDELKLDCLPFDDLDFSRVLDALTTREFVVHYASGSEEYGSIPSFRKHQVINNRERASELPEPPQKQKVVDACPTRQVHAQGEGNMEGNMEGKGSLLCDPPSKPKSNRKKKSVDYSPAFEATWKLYPKRGGDNPKSKAWDKWLARIRAGMTEQDLADAVVDYAVYCDAADKTGTEFVKHGSTFFGNAENITENWRALANQCKTNGGTNGKRFETAFDRLHRACADPAPGNGRGETIEGHAEILGADG